MPHPARSDLFKAERAPCCSSGFFGFGTSALCRRCRFFEFGTTNDQFVLSDGSGCDSCDVVDSAPRENGSSSVRPPRPTSIRRSVRSFACCK
jgi:hypothetical protein